MDDSQISNQILNDIINAIVNAKHTITKIWMLRILERYDFEIVKSVYESLLRNDLETFIIYESLAPEPLSRKLREMKQKALKEDEELRQKFVKLVEEISNEYPNNIFRLYIG